MTKETLEIKRGLARIRMLRRVFLFILFSYLPILALTMACIERFGTWLPIILPAVLFALGMFVQHRLHRQRCPRCGSYFFVQSMTLENYTPFSSISFPPQRRCQSCSLVLYRK